MHCFITAAYYSAESSLHLIIMSAKWAEEVSLCPVISQQGDGSLTTEIFLPQVKNIFISQQLNMATVHCRLKISWRYPLCHLCVR